MLSESRESLLPVARKDLQELAAFAEQEFGLEDLDEVSSPTFTLINQYQGKVRIYHIDLYRIEPGRLEGLGLDEIFDDPDAAVIIEWAERLGNFRTPGAVQVFLEYVDDTSRKIEIK